MANTFTTLVEFIIGFLLLSAGSRHAYALMLKIDELLRVTEGARKELIDLEEQKLRILHEAQEEFNNIAEKARENV